MLSKRSYLGSEERLLRLARAYNDIRPRTALIQTDRDGTLLLYLAGWDDWNAAAVWELVNSNVPPEAIDERIVRGKATELFNSGSPLRAEALGRVIMSDAGSVVPVDPDLSETTGTDEQPEERAEMGRVDIPPGFDPTLPPGANLPSELERQVGARNEPEVKRSFLGVDERGKPCLMVKLEGDETNSHVLLQAQAITVKIGMEGRPLRWLQALSVLQQKSPAQLLKELIEEGISREIRMTYSEAAPEGEREELT